MLRGSLNLLFPDLGRHQRAHQRSYLRVLYFLSCIQMALVFQQRPMHRGAMAVHAFARVFLWIAPETRTFSCISLISVAKPVYKDSMSWICGATGFKTLPKRSEPGLQ